MSLAENPNTRRPVLGIGCKPLKLEAYKAKIKFVEVIVPEEHAGQNLTVRREEVRADRSGDDKIEFADPSRLTVVAEGAVPSPIEVVIPEQHMQEGFAETTPTPQAPAVARCLSY
jgi:hypothetical protein